MSLWDDYLPLICVTAIVVPIALLLGYFFWVNRSPDTKEMRDALFSAKPYDIRNIEVNWIEPARKSAEALAFSDPKSVTEIMEALSTATEASSPHDRKTWSVLLTVTHVKRTVKVLVVGYDSAGATLQLNSNGTSGWNLGTYNCAQLGPVLQRLAGIPLKPAAEKASD